MKFMMSSRFQVDFWAFPFLIMIMVMIQDADDDDNSDYVDFHRGLNFASKEALGTLTSEGQIQAFDQRVAPPHG